MYGGEFPVLSWRAQRPVVTRARAGCRERQPGAGRPRTPVDGCVPFKVGVCAGARSEDRASRQLKAGAPAEGGNAASSACALVGEGRTCQRAVRGLSVGARPAEPQLPHHYCWFFPLGLVFDLRFAKLYLSSCSWRLQRPVSFCIETSATPSFSPNQLLQPKSLLQLHL